MNFLKVLVVDDNFINQKVAVKMLERSHFVADVANNGLEAVDAVKKQRYDLILMDVQMPHMDGYDATKTIRSIEQNEFHTTIIALTANAMQGDRERCLQAGMDDYLSKPIKQQDIDKMVEKWLTSKTIVGRNGIERVETAIPEIIDPQRIKEITEIGDASLLQELLLLYLEDLKQFSVEMITERRENNFQRIYECSHKLKGSSANLGIESIRQSCARMEQYAKESDSAKITMEFAAMQNMMEQIRTHIVTTYPAQ